jgi:hypothetical protein
MKTVLASLAAIAALTAAATPAAAQNYGWQPVNERQANLDRRIDQGVRTGQLSRREAYRLRAEFHDIARLEARYRAGGLSARERRDLDRRFDRLSAEIRAERHDRDHRRGW